MSARRRIWIMALGGVIVVGVVIVAVLAMRGRSVVAKQDLFIAQVKALGGFAQRDGTGPTGLLARIPLVRELRVEVLITVFLPNSKVAADVMPLLDECPGLGRIWVHRDDVSAEIQAKLTSKYSPLWVNRYTPAVTSPSMGRKVP
jgi:hypothetical protein